MDNRSLAGVVQPLQRLYERCSHNLYRRTVPILALLFCLGVALMLWHVARLQTGLMETMALGHADLYTQALAEFRTLYTSEVVERVRHRGIEVTHDYESKEGAIPLPATLSMKLGQSIGQHRSGAETRLYSAYPFPWREELGGLRDTFGREAWRALTQNPAEPFYGFEEVDGRLSLRYATADLMRDACVNCHNTHPDSPKTDWKAGDVRGVLEIIHPIDMIAVQVHSGMGQTFGVMAVLAVLWLGGLGLVISKLRRDSADLLKANAGLETENMECKRLEEEQKASHDLMSAISRVQAQFIVEEESQVAFDNILTKLLSLTQSEYGFMGEILLTADGKQYLKAHAITNIAWNEETRALFERSAPNLEFYNLQTLFGAVMTSGKPVIANSPAEDPRRGGLPPGHPPLNAFLGIPFYHGERLVGMVGIANRPGGYNDAVVEYLQPFLSTCATLLEAYRNEQRRRKAQDTLRESEARVRRQLVELRQIYNTAPVGLALIDADLRYLRINEHLAAINGRPAADHLGRSVQEILPEIAETQEPILLAVINTKKPLLNVEVHGVTPADPGTERDWLVSYYPVVDRGEVLAVNVVVQEITERKRAEQALRRAHEELEARVAERTANLEVANTRLEAEVAERMQVMAALQESVREFRALSESLPIGVFEVDGAGNCLYKNQAWEQIFGVETLDGGAGNWMTWFHPDDRTALEQAWNDAKTWYSRIIQECRIATANGIERWTELQLSPMIGDERARYLGTIEDITERKRAESALLQLIRHNHMILSSAEEGIYGLDLEGKTTFMNPAAARMLGYEPEELIGKPQHDLSHHSKPDGSPYPRKGCPIYAAFTDGTVHHVETEVFWRRDGTSFPVEYTSTPIRDEHDHLIGAVVTFHDITERKQAEEQLTEAYARLQQLTIQLAAAEEEERKRIARELHDEFGQILAGMKFDLAWLGKQLNGKTAASRPAVRDKVRSMSALVDTTIQTVQRISASLRPGILDDLGLAAAVEWLGRGFQTRTGCDCEVTVSPRITEMAIKAERGLALFRIAQELLTNVMRHAQASRVRLSLDDEADDLILNVEDNGRGIAESALVSPNSLGLKGIRERLSLVGGAVSIQAKQGKGTTVTVRVPAG